MGWNGTEWQRVKNPKSEQQATLGLIPPLIHHWLWPRTVDVTCNFWFPREIQRFDPGSCIHIIQGCSMYFNIFQYSSLHFYISIQINQVNYIYLSSPKDMHGYPIYFYVFFVYIHCSIDRWNISLFYLYFYIHHYPNSPRSNHIHHYPNSPRSKHILLTYIIYPLISVTQWLFNDYPRIFMDYYHIYIYSIISRYIYIYYNYYGIYSPKFLEISICWSISIQ